MLHFTPAVSNDTESTPAYFLEGTRKIPLVAVLELIRMSPGNKVTPIKVLRSLTDIGLKEAKDIVDAVVLSEEIAKQIR